MSYSRSKIKMKPSLLIVVSVAILIVGSDGRPRMRAGPGQAKASPMNGDVILDAGEDEGNEIGVEDGENVSVDDDGVSEWDLSSASNKNAKSLGVKGVSLHWAPDLYKKFKTIANTLTQSQAWNDALEIVGKIISKVSYAVEHPDMYAPKGSPPPPISKIIQAQNSRFAILPLKSKKVDSDPKLNPILYKFPTINKPSWKQEGTEDQDKAGVAGPAGRRGSSQRPSRQSPIRTAPDESFAEFSDSHEKRRGPGRVQIDPQQAPVQPSKSLSSGQIISGIKRLLDRQLFGDIVKIVGAVLKDVTVTIDSADKAPPSHKRSQTIGRAMVKRFKSKIPTSDEQEEDEDYEEETEDEEDDNTLSPRIGTYG